MDIAVVVLIAGLFVWRITHMLHSERGPFDIFVRLRAYLAKRQKRSGGLYDMISCFNCLSVWVAMLPALLAPNLFGFVVSTLVLSAVAILINQLFNKSK